MRCELLGSGQCYSGPIGQSISIVRWMKPHLIFAVSKPPVSLYSSRCHKKLYSDLVSQGVSKGRESTHHTSHPSVPSQDSAFSYYTRRLTSDTNWVGRECTKNADGNVLHLLLGFPAGGETFSIRPFPAFPLTQTAGGVPLI